MTPQKVGAVCGPASFIRTLETVETDRVDISSAKQDVFARQVPVSVSNPKSAVLNTVVDVTVRIGEKRIERRLSLTVSGKRLGVVFFGPRSLLEHLRSEDLKAEIVRSESGVETPRLDLPETLQGSVEVRSLKIVG